MPSVVRCPSCDVRRNQFHEDDCKLVQDLGLDVVDIVNGKPAWLGSSIQAHVWGQEQRMQPGKKFRDPMDIEKEIRQKTVRFLSVDPLDPESMLALTINTVLGECSDSWVVNNITLERTEAATGDFTNETLRMHAIGEAGMARKVIHRIAEQLGIDIWDRS